LATLLSDVRLRCDSARAGAGVPPSSPSGFPSRSFFVRSTTVIMLFTTSSIAAAREG
jgi:hypothetical protein